QFYGALPSQIEVDEAGPIEVGDIITSILEVIMAIGGLLAVLLRTILHSSPEDCHQVCRSRRSGSNGKHKHNYTMTYMQHIRYCKHKRTVYVFNYIISRSST